MTLIKKRLLENLNSRRLDSALNIIVSLFNKTVLWWIASSATIYTTRQRLFYYSQ